MNLAIIGAGASGLVAAIEASKRGLHVSVFEKNAKLGRKILATGNGRCNITNQNINTEHYHSMQPRFINATLSRFGSAKCVNYFRELGLEVREGEKGRLYPMNHQSSTVVDMLVHFCRQLGVQFFLESEVVSLEKNGEKFCLHVNNATHLFDACLVATGGLAMPTLGSCESGYVFAKKMGHTLINPHPSLVQIVCEEKSIQALSGVKVEGEIAVIIEGEKKKSAVGDLLFTHYGLSGSAVLDVSREISLAISLKRSVHVMLDIMPQFSKEQLENLLQKRLSFAQDKSLVLWLEGIINKKLAPFIIQQAALPKSILNASMLGMKEIKKLAYALKHISLHVNDTKGFGSAEVTAGGVDVREINPESFESKIVKNLYFSGEVLDVDGDCGGYNLHFAWASGFVAGNAIGKR
ncbi:MAG: NAD(P)/FAD-dependent oxidoreductase [Sulfurospirillaceae bacterium]|nr:NAD(P)/FAD-dependent oxidoreductase [Sulfurospirillaceae bacterium]MDD2826667.1 NAD(P)/FAD-dependent oxidoreductase [Sulfurospirillaceae bacterium]